MRNITKIVLATTLLMGIANAYAQVDVRKNAVAFSEGLECKYKEDTECAIKKFKEALKYMPDDAASMYELSQQYADVGLFDEGFEMIKKAVETDSDNKWYKLRYARYCEMLSMTDEMISTYEQLLDKELQNIELLGELIEALEESLEYDKALSYLDKVEKVIGANETIIDEKIKIYTQQGKTKKVISELEKAVKAQPENSKYSLTLAKIYMDNGKEKDAVKLYENIKSTDPDDQYASVALLEYYDKKGDTKQAFDELLAAIRNKNLDFHTKATIYEYWFNKTETNNVTAEQAFECGKAFIEAYPEEKSGYIIVATYHLFKNNLKEANKMYVKALECDSTDYTAWQNLVLSDFDMKNYDVMTQHAEKALQYYPNQSIFYWYAGVGKMIAEKNAEAIAYMEKGRRFAIDDQIEEDFNNHLGNLYHAIGDNEKAYDAYDRVLEHNPDNVLVLNNYAYYLSLDGKNLDKALSMSKHAIELSPNIATYIDTYAWVLFKLGRYEEAELAMRKMLDNKKESNGVYYEHYGDMLFKLGRANEAMKYWKKAKEKGNASKDIDKKIEKGGL